MKIRIDPLDKLFSQYIRLLNGNVCKRCGKYSKQLQCAHFHSRRKKSVRWDRSNATALCYGCHSFIDGNPLEKVEFFMEILGKDEFDALNERAKQIFPKPDKKTISISILLLQFWMSCFMFKNFPF